MIWPSRMWRSIISSSAVHQSAGISSTISQWKTRVGKSQIAIRLNCAGPR